jgi:hypothetical protein
MFISGGPDRRIKNPLRRITYWLFFIPLCLLILAAIHPFTLYFIPYSTLPLQTLPSRLIVMIKCFRLPAVKVNYDDERVAKTIVNKFITCKKYEETYKRPLKIAKNLIQSDVEILLQPLAIYLSVSGCYLAVFVPLSVF